MNYCYARVSTVEQHLDRQIVAFKPYEPYILFQDKESGKDFNRTNYKKMKRKLKNGDVLIVLSLDRFGRNYDQIKEEWRDLSIRGVKIKIIDMPIIDTTTNDLTSKLISDIVIQLLSYVAQTERETMHKRQAQGIKAAKERGVKFGRPTIKLPDNFHEVAKLYCKRVINNKEAVEQLGLSRGTFFRYLKKYDYIQYKPLKEKTLKKCQIFAKFKSGEFRTHKVSELLGCDTKEWYPQYCKWKLKGERN